ncbi:MAG: sulfatase-like hydrolase/transferase [Candidatus Solibacter sp.]
MLSGRNKTSDWLAAFSLANLAFLRCWAETLGLSAPQGYWLKSFPKPVDYLTLLGDVLLLGTAIFWLIRSLRVGSKLATRILIGSGLLLLVSLVNSLRTLVGSPGTSMFLRFVDQRAAAIGIVVAIALVTALVIGGIRALRPIYSLLILLSPFVFITAAQSVYKIVTYDDTATRDGPLAARLAPKPAGSPRVVWVIFDEWDFDLSFADRPANLRLPEIDRLRAESISANQVAPPNYFTDWSMPALTTGVPVQDVHPKGPSELMILLAGGSGYVPWSRQNNVFREARKLGFNTGVVAWAIPYCRVLKEDLSNCWWWAGSNQFNSLGDTAPEMLLNRPRSLYENTYRSPFGQSLSTIRHASVTRDVVAKALEVARDGSVGFSLLHLPVPHPPYFYNAATGKNNRGATPIKGLFEQNQRGYFDALVLTDRTLGQMRREMEQAGVWDTSTVLLSSDHPFRHRQALDGKPRSAHIPYILKMAGAAQPGNYDHPISALITKKLVLAILSGEISGAAQVPAWLDAHRAEYPLD